MVAWQTAWYYENIDFSAMPFKMRELSQLIKITSFLSGKELRLKLTNYYGKEELIFDEIYVALTADMKEKQRVTALYQDTIVIPQGEAIWTDSIDLDIKVGQTIYVYMKSSQEQEYCDFKCTYETSLTNASFARSANFLPKLSDTWQSRKGWFCLEEVDVWTKANPKYLEITGDSLMEMGMITAPLMQYLMTVHPDEVTVLNTAISGSRLIHDAPHDQPIYETFGESLLSRMVRNRSGFKPELTIVSIGANDLMLPLISEVAARQKITKDNFFNAVQRLNEILEKRNSELILLDIPPFTLSHTGRPDDKELQAQKFRKELNSTKCI